MKILGIKLQIIINFYLLWHLISCNNKFVQTESGRIWFSRVVNARRARACVTEASFYSLAQHFAVALFECHEADDFAPAKSLMNMCFTFYHEGNTNFLGQIINF